MKNFIQKNSKLVVVFTATALTILGACSSIGIDHGRKCRESNHFRL